MSDGSENPAARAVRTQLRQLVAAHGPQLLDDARRVRAMLADAVTGATAEANLIGLALSSGAPAKLTMHGRGDVSRVVDEAARELERISSVQRPDALWAVDAIAYALGLADPDDRFGSAGTVAGPRERAVERPGPDDLLVRWPRGERTIAGHVVATIGRDQDNTVVIDSPAVSRNHGRLQRENGAWVYTDLGSTQGSYARGVAVRTLPVREGVDLVLGQGPEAVTLSLLPAGAPAGAPANGPLRPPLPATEAAGAPRPGGALVQAPGAARTELGGGGVDGLTVTLGGDTRTVTPGETLTVGREEGNDLVAPETTVSRQHVRIEHDGGAWTLRDLGTTAGTWLGGKRVGTQRLSGRQEFVLGDPPRGARLVTQTTARGGAGGRVPAALRKPQVLIAVSVVAALLLGLVSWLAFGARDSAVSNNDLAKATVHLDVGDGSGSGTIIDKKRGLILTNAHVAAPTAVGQALRTLEFADDIRPDPTEIVVSVSSGLDQAAEPRFIAKVVTADGYLDIAVIQIVKTLSGANVESADLNSLTEVRLGNSDKLKSSDPIKYFGYPAAARSSAPTFTTGVVSGVVQDDRLGTNKAEMNASAITSGGNSGGLVTDEQGRMVGVHTWGRIDEAGNRIFSGFRPINLAMPVIDAARSGTAYTSPWSTAGPTSATVADDLAAVQAGSPGSINATCVRRETRSEYLAVGLTVSGLPSGEHTDVMVALFDDDGDRAALATTTLKSTYPVKLPAAGCLTVTFDEPVAAGSYVLKVGVGGDLKVIRTMRIRIT